jgi:hypothetical protein
MRTLVVGTARNISSVWAATSRYLDIIFDSVGEYETVIVESNSQDDTPTLLDNWQKQDSRRHAILCGQLSEPSRTKRIAHCRNKYMEYLDDNITKFDYLLVVDLDSSFEIYSDFKSQLASCFTRNNWDSVASNRRGRYYDIWALRSKQLGIDFDCWERVGAHSSIFGSRNPISFMRNISHPKSIEYNTQMFVGKYQKVIPESDDWIECQSAFGGMALYKTSSVHKRRYNGDTTCEHVSFNQGLKIFINPRFISGGEYS